MLKRLAVNTSSNLLQMVVGMVVTFVMAPIYLTMLGHHDYGLREMVMAIAGYMGVLQLGMGPTVSRFAAMHNATKDREQLLIVYASSLVFMSLVGLLIAVFFWVWALYYPEILSADPGDNVVKYSLFLLIVGAQLLFGFPKLVTESYLEGLQRYYIKNIINILSMVTIAVVSYIYMTPENALVLLVSLVAVFVLLQLITFGALLWRPAMGSIYPHIGYFSFAKLKEMLTFGLKSCIQGAAQKIETTSDRLVIGALLGPASVPLYTIPSTLVAYVSNITMTLTHTFMPLFSDLSAKGRDTEIRGIYLVSSKFVVGLMVPMIVGICLVGGPFIDIWMNQSFDRQKVDLILILLALYIGVPKLNPFVSRYLTAINKHGIFAKVAPPAALLNLALSIWFVIEFGVVGAALGSVFPVFIVTPIYLLAVSRELAVKPLQYVTACLLPSVVPLAAMAGFVAWMRANGMLDSYFGILITIGTGALIYCILFFTVSVNKMERQFVLSRIQQIRDS